MILVINNLRNLLSISFLIVLAIVSSTPAYELDGSFSSQLYWYEDAQFVHIRPYESLRLNWYAWENKGRQLSFHTNARFTTDLNDRLSSDPQLFIRSAYLKFRYRRNRVQANLGRQFVYSAAGSALIDGIRFKINKIRYLDLDLFTGTSVSRLDPEKVRSYSDNMVIGGRAAYKANSSFRPGINWMIEKREGSVSRSRLSLDSRYNYQRWQLYSRVGFNPMSSSLAEILARASWSDRQWYLSGEYLLRDPNVGENSVFSLISFERYRLVRVQARRKLSAGFSLFTYQQYSLKSEDNSYDLSVGVQRGKLTLGWRHQGGQGGDYNSLFGSIRTKTSTVWDLYSNFNLGRYKVQTIQEEFVDAYSANVGLERRFLSGVGLTGEVQFIRNGVKGNDWRLFLQLKKSFQMKD